MRLQAPLFILLAAALPGLAAAATTKTTPTPAPAAATTPVATGGLDATPAKKLEGNQCLSPAQVRSTVTLSDREVLVDGGRYRYRIITEANCSDLAETIDVRFRGGAMSTKVCGGGDVREAVISKKDVCRIGRIEIIEKDVFDAGADAHHAELKAERSKNK